MNNMTIPSGKTIKTDSTRIFVIGDIHGCNQTFRKLIFNTLELQKDDTLILLGDYIDRGSDSKGVLDTIMELQKQDYNVNSILGNHEDMLLQVFKAEDYDIFEHWLHNGGAETLSSFGVSYFEDIPEEYIAFIKAQPLYLIAEKHVFIHAGLDFKHKNPLFETSRNEMLWIRRFKVAAEKIGNRKLVTGHTAINLDEIMKSLNTNLIQLDNGCYLKDKYEKSGNLVALELNFMQVFIQKNID